MIRIRPLAAALLLVLAACDTGSSPEGPAPGPRGYDLTWADYGPDDPRSPTPLWPVYNAFAARDCAAVEAADPGAPMARALAALCAAVVDGDSGQWSAAAQAYGEVETPYFAVEEIGFNCLDDAVDNLVTAALAWHAANPDGTPRVRFPVARGKSDCGEQWDESLTTEPLPPESTSETTTDNESGGDGGPADSGGEEAAESVPPTG